jgi:hypothetical protein
MCSTRKAVTSRGMQKYPNRFPERTSVEPINDPMLRANRRMRMATDGGLELAELIVCIVSTAPR